jgi:hypothetical protein
VPIYGLSFPPAVELDNSLARYFFAAQISEYFCHFGAGNSCYWNAAYEYQLKAYTKGIEGSQPIYERFD